MVVYTYSKARQQLASLLKRAKKDGQVIIKKKDGQTFVVKAVKGVDTNSSPFDVKGVKLGIKTEEIVNFVHQGRRTV
jgi:prevent-host-death family protein